MFGNGSSDLVRQMFADQFEADGNDFLYRKFLKGAPIRVSASERDRYVATFNRHMKYLIWGILGVTVVVCTAPTLYAIQTGTNVWDAANYAGIGLIGAAFMADYVWAWNFPARELRGRPTVGDARSRAQTRQLLLGRTTYGQIAAGAAIAVFLLARLGIHKDMLSGWNILWAVLAVFILAAAAILAFRKWRLGSARRRRVD
jgi:hypothetical protein